MHLLPQDELRRQFESGEIDREYYEAMRGTRTEPADRLCETPGCKRQAYRMDCGKALCAVCILKATTARRRGW